MTSENRLPEAVARQVLARAAQLDASDRAGVSIPELRTAAMEVGISSSALDRALGEMADVPSASAENVAIHRGSRRTRLALAVIAVMITLFGALRLVPTAGPAETPVEVEVPSRR